MAASGTRTRILFVDDEPGIRLTFAPILQQKGFEVTAAATVAEALRQINSQPFDALISDLNIGEPGDGFTVVSAMRRTQPGCINFILTGYPAFESALQAIRNQVDDYLVKPADVEELVATLESRLRNPKKVRHFQTQSMAEFLSEHGDQITRRTLMAMKPHPRLSRILLSDSQRTHHVPQFLDQLIHQLNSERPETPTAALLTAGAAHGATRRRQGYTAEMLLDDNGLLDCSIYDAVQDGLLDLKLSNLVPDLKCVNIALNQFLQESLKAFDMEKAA